jgi:hypothetical protein
MFIDRLPAAEALKSLESFIACSGFHHFWIKGPTTTRSHADKQWSDH